VLGYGSAIVRPVGCLLWVLTGTITVIAAVSYGELSAMFPKAGGQYVYIKEAYGKLVGFTVGALPIQTGTIAAVGVALQFAAYLCAFK
jgi:APA family basic amino acid/polyamine antiporter